jgi:phosphatidylinositol-3-phosphatase
LSCFTRTFIRLLLAVLILGGTLANRSSGYESAPRDASMPEFQHVFVVVEENQNYQDVVGNTKDMPYLNSLIQRYGLATNYFANFHPSVNNYFVLTAGRSGIPHFWASGGGLADHYWGLVSGENIASVLTDNKKTWRAYLEDLPAPGSLVSSHDNYVKRHNPFAYFASVVHGTKQYPSQKSNLVPFEGNFERDLRNQTLPNYSFIVPNTFDDGHTDRKTGKAAKCDDGGPLQEIDRWLNKNIKPLVESADFQQSGLLIITFDEACDSGSKSDNRFAPGTSTRGGGRVPAIIISSKIKPGTTSDRLLHHESVLRLSLRALGIDRFPGTAAAAPDLFEFF